MYPRIIADLNKLKSNTDQVASLCGKHGVNIMGVTKVFCGRPEIAKAYVEGGVKYLADARIENLKKIQNLPCEKVLLRLPMISQASEVVKYADISLNSEIATIKALNACGENQNKKHKIILMIDLGDLREGILKDQVDETVEAILELKHIEILGLGVNLTCYGGVIPTKENLSQLIEIHQHIRDKFGLNLELVSGGNSSSYYLLEENSFPKGINNLRMGEILVLGRETTYGNLVEGLHDDVFIFEAEVVELKEKPSLPIGKIGMDAFGNVPSFEDKGIRKRGILATGVQDVKPSDLIPVDEKITLLGASSDHMIWDLTESEVAYKVGDVIRFKVSYGALLALYTSEYIHKFSF